MKFINPQNVVAQMGLSVGQTVADFGSGSGYFAIAAAKMVGNTGVVLAVDVQQSKLTAVSSIAGQQGYKNIRLVQEDLDNPVKNIPDGSCDAVIMASVLHEVHNREQLLKNAYKVLKTGGLVLAVEWKAEHTIFGPDQTQRIPEEKLETELTNLGLQKVKIIPADMSHYAIVFKK